MLMDEDEAGEWSEFLFSPCFCLSCADGNPFDGNVLRVFSNDDFEYLITYSFRFPIFFLFVSFLPFPFSFDIDRNDISVRCQQHNDELTRTPKSNHHQLHITSHRVHLCE